jgi:hypothetical protein
MENTRRFADFVAAGQLQNTLQNIAQNVQNIQQTIESETYQPKSDVGRWLDFNVSGDGTTNPFRLVNIYSQLYRGFIVNGVEIIQTAGTPNVSSVQSIRLVNRRIDGQDNDQVTIINLTKYKSDALSNDTKIIAKGLRFPIDGGQLGCAFDSVPYLVFQTAPPVGQNFLVRFYIERIVGKESFI